MIDDTTKINKSRPPLRWLANGLGDIAAWAILHISYQDELEKFGWRYKIYSFIWKITWPIYYRFGTFYQWNLDMSGNMWDDYDEDGVPYWEKTGTIDPDYVQPWQFVDPWTGDAFRLIKKEKS